MATGVFGTAFFSEHRFLPLTICLVGCLIVAVTSSVLNFHPQDRTREGLRVLVPSQNITNSSDWYNCYEDKCKCLADQADCSMNQGRLTFIPELPAGIKTLNFSFNNLEALPGDFFANVTQLSFVDLSYNDVVTIHPDAFKSMLNLSSLVLKEVGSVSYEELEPVFSLDTLQELDVSGLSLGSLPVDFFEKHPLKELKTLNMFGNRLVSGDLTAFSRLSSLTQLEVGYNDVVSLQTNVELSLQTLAAEQNELRQLSKTCSSNSSSSLFPYLVSLKLQNNFINDITFPICLPRLQFLDLSNNYLSSIVTNSFSAARFPSLTTLRLDSMLGGVSRVEDLAFNNSVLQDLSLANNGLRSCDDTSMKVNSFLGCGTLRVLSMKSNDFSQPCDDRLHQVFFHLPHLQELDLSSCAMKVIFNVTVVGPPSLRKLSLGSNLFQSLPDGFVDSTELLTDLDLTKNKLAFVNETTFNDTTRARLQHLDLSGNPFISKCDLRWFAEWFKSQEHLLFKTHKYPYQYCWYICSDHSDNNKYPLKNFYMADQACFFGNDTQDYYSYICFSFMGVILYITIMLTVFTIVRIFENPLLVREFKGEEHGMRFGQQDHDYQYDVFVAYAEGDQEWIDEQLGPQLEGRLGLRLCLHQRDFHPGRNILENIEDSMEKSRKVLVVFSTHFARSQWCQFELSLGQRHAMDVQDVLTVVCMEHVQPRDWTAAMLAIIRTYTYLQWLPQPHHRNDFWHLLSTALRDIIPPQ